MKELNSSQIRQMFLDFFASKGHEIVPSKNLIPQDDPTLLWINSGVATLKKYFDGSAVPENPRITNAQKAIRTNDIENVGKTARHHTLFEMMGNFSIGDYFKEEGIPWAWELLTSPKWYGLDKDLLYVTVYPKDTEAKKIWQEKTDIPEGHIYEVEDNFWDIGEGPSGPDSEIFFDRGKDFQDLPDNDPEMYPGGENERYLEIWNIVFSQFNHLPGLTDNAQYPELPHKNIDTGMGLERVVSVFQKGRTNFDTDLFLPIIKATESMSDGFKYDSLINSESNTSFKVIADHIRAVTFAIGDGALPSNEGRGYVIRRLLRRAVLHGQKLGITGEFLTQLVPVVGNIMQSYYPEILENTTKIQKTIAAEEKRFNATLTGGLALLNQVINQAKAEGKTQLSGGDAFKLSDTYGFPLELTQEQAAESDLTVDIKGFNDALQAQRTRARAARTTDKSMGIQNAVLTDLKVESQYVGWSVTAVDDAKIMAIIGQDDQGVDALLSSAVTGQKLQLVFDKTPFYAEMGGQVADYGEVLTTSGKVVARVIDVQNAPNGQHIHTVNVLCDFNLMDTVNLQVDISRHIAISKNHTATHMLDQSLRNIIGGDIHQAGSLVEPEYLRFDFTNEGPVSEENIEKIETLMNHEIANNLPVSWLETDIESAKKMGAVAVFGEKYGALVRVVSIGDFNKEFDGGTHVKSTSELGLFKIVSESGIGAGVRRIEAVTGLQAIALYKAEENALKAIATTVKAQRLTDVPSKVADIQAELKATQRTLESLESQLANAAAAEVFSDVKTSHGHSYITAQLQVSGMDGLRQVADNWKTNYPSDVLVLAATVDGRVNLIVTASPSANAAGIKAGDLIKTIAPRVGGGGGGRPDMAQAGGKNPAGISEAFAEVANYLAKV
ncbi:alanine--tRNA ligase [Leuconostoc gelidum subsp. gelidum]|uniref:Alanine--tRNA ligase n=1 Tax=Leuconostoc gelidum subsp. gelidum TaxID=1607839 RepID=A0AB35G0M1_LEUGE|nr:alanine--tRNA ligase [Leuconostoc gelidum]MBZ5963898.1 alanine--tRNA ligase [Leuconostoc gelidum subsp. gelidum]MBZ5975258.1 alanine--tRNA ligase [Leuconostoc gelidum subsp. gelidum]MBZ5976571.1 alanine--tRNA ligase [Leuconostoc gelidum subsp. gelidum]MBZ5985583.1 alanine--tRNA ligase [Leuconostoc gelidum subsp. gelidum]MBZ6000553.1 alanine--tRNA ligase [Leuconostoc gelidum subsp. gelidum]